MGNRLNIPVPPQEMTMGGRSKLNTRTVGCVRRATRLFSRQIRKTQGQIALKGKLFAEPMVWSDASKKYSLVSDGDRTKTDTGG